MCIIRMVCYEGFMDIKKLTFEKLKGFYMF